MPQAFSQDLRVRIVARFDEGHSYEDVAEMFDVAYSTVRRFVTLAHKEGLYSARPHGGGAPKALNGTERTLLAKCQDKWPDKTLKELTALFNRAAKRSISVITVGRELRALGYTRKKNAQSRRAKSR